MFSHGSVVDFVCRLRSNAIVVWGLASASWSLLSSWPSWWSSSDNAVSRSWYSPPAQCGGSPTSYGYAYYYYY
eukprot:3882485-Amphidinium_carterae.1